MPHVKVLEGSKAVADFWVGGFRFNQQTRSGTSFVRLSDADDVYAVDGFLSMSFGQGFDSYRNKTMLKFNKDDITQVAFTQDGQSSTLLNSSGQWTSDSGVTVDSTKMANYLSSIANFNGSKFADDFQENQFNIQSRQSLTITGNNMTAPIAVNCFLVAGAEQAIVCKSSLNPDAYFAGDSTNLYNRLFKTLEDLQ